MYVCVCVCVCAAESLPTKPRFKIRGPWEATAIREKRDDMKNSSFFL